ncbi:hypothetical protein [Breoghania sp.]|uniref:hypothetical protein n=1 Tax=Breoghania sp. TaxID=2065378 RepID=UPI0029CA6FFF|nr:hypothetical protein [Breoghania sp.]
MIRILIALVFTSSLAACVSTDPNGPRLYMFNSGGFGVDQGMQIQKSYVDSADCWTRPKGRFPQFVVDHERTINNEKKAEIYFVYRDQPEKTALKLLVITDSAYLVQGTGPENSGPLGTYIAEIHRKVLKGEPLQMCRIGGA